MVREFRDAVVIQDASGLERGVSEGRQVIESLKALAAIESSTAGSTEVDELATVVERFLHEARETYAEALANPNEMTTALQGRVRELASKTESLDRSLEALDQRSSSDLSQELTMLQVRSQRARRLVLFMFGATLVVAAVLVNV